MQQAAPKRRGARRASAAAPDRLVEDAARVLKTLSPLPNGDVPITYAFERVERGYCPWMIGREVHEEARIVCLTSTLVSDKGQQTGKLGKIVRERANGHCTYRLTEDTSRAFARAIDDEWESFDYVTKLQWMYVAGRYNQWASAQCGKGTPFRPMSGYEVYCEQWPKVLALIASRPIVQLPEVGVDDECARTRWNALMAETREMYDKMANDRNAWRFLREHGERETWDCNPFRPPEILEDRKRAAVQLQAAVQIQAAVRGHRARAAPQGRAVKTSDGSVHLFRGPSDRERRFRIERANGNIEHYVPSETHRADGRRWYTEWPNGRIDLYDGPDDNRRCVHSIHPDGYRDHYEGDAGREVRTRRDCPDGRVQIFGTDGDKQFIREERWPRSGVRRVYHGRFATSCTETFGPTSEPAWVFCSRREQLDATMRAHKAAWAPHENGDEAGAADGPERACDGRERKRMSAALYKRVSARMSSTNACPKDARLRVGLRMHAAFMDADAHPNLAGLLRGPPGTFDAVFDSLVKQTVAAELEAVRVELKAKCAERDELEAEHAKLKAEKRVGRKAERDPLELARLRAKLLTELRVKLAEPWKGQRLAVAEPWREPTHDERKRAVALGREVIEALGDLATDEIVAQIAVQCGDGETIEVARATEETLKAAHAEIKAERADSKERERPRVALEKRVDASEKAERDAEAAAAELVRSEADERVATEKKRAEKARKKREAAQRKAEAARCAKAAAAAQRREERPRAAERAARVEAKRAARAGARGAGGAGRGASCQALRPRRAGRAGRSRRAAQSERQVAKALAARRRAVRQVEAARAAQREALREHQRGGVLGPGGALQLEEAAAAATAWARGRARRARRWARRARRARRCAQRSAARGGRRQALCSLHGQ